MRLLLLQETPVLANVAMPVLNANGFDFDLLTRLDAAGEAVLAPYHAVLVDRRLPDGCGLAWLRRRRGAGFASPVVVVVPADDVEERIKALDAGADDCVVRSITGRELLARLRAVLRRPPQLLETILEAGNVAFNTATRQVWIGGRPVAIPKRELSLLEHLMRRAGRVVPRAALESDLYGNSEGVCANSFEVRMSRLRRRLDEAQASVVIGTVRGAGYMLGPAAEAPRAMPRSHALPVG